jgi:TetR/AcrR family transcriptional repressor of nem operon
MGRCSDSKCKLLQVAFELIWQQSYRAVSVDDICDRAGVRKGSFYHFFPSKSDLAVAAYEEYWQRCRAKYDTAFSPQIPPLERFHNYCQILFERQSEQFQATGRVPGCPFGSLAGEVATLDEKIRQAAMETLSRKCVYFESALRDAHREGLVEDMDFSAKARSIVSLIMGVLLQAKINNDLEILRTLETNILCMIGVVTQTSTL